MNPFRIVLIAAALIAVEVTESPFRKVLNVIWLDSDQQKAAQCLTVSHFLPENAAGIWSGAANERISYWLEHQSGCSTAKECMRLRLSVTDLAERKAHPDGDRPDLDILSKWEKSDYCQTLVASYKEKSRQGENENSKQEKASQPQVQSVPQTAVSESVKLTESGVEHSPDAKPNTSEDAMNKASGKSWQDTNGFIHYPDGSISNGPVD